MLPRNQERLWWAFLILAALALIVQLVAVFIMEAKQ